MSLFEAFNLGQGFRKYFRIEAASSTEVRDEVFRVRHEVYCEELGFEPVRPTGAKPTPTMRTAFTACCEPRMNLLTLSAAHVWCLRTRATRLRRCHSKNLFGHAGPLHHRPLEAPARDDCGGFQVGSQVAFSPPQG